MEEIKTSAFLSRILKEAELIGPAQKEPMSVEKMLVAMIDVFYAITEEEKDPEIKTAERILVGMLGDLADAKKALLSYIHGENRRKATDALYFRKRMGEAKGMVSSVMAEEVDAVALLLVVREMPSKVLCQIMEQKDKVEEEPLVPFPDLFADNEESLFEDDEEDVPMAAPQAARQSLVKLVNEVKNIRTELRSAVFGQDNAINVFTSGYFQARLMELTDPNRKRPRATFLFAGPPGVGKTFLAEKVADSLGLPFMRFDMSEYADKEANIEFCGSDKVYKNGKVGNVTSFVAENPRCVLLFDEIEKAHLCVIHLFLQMLDAGRLRDNYTDREVSFSEALIILTTNAGKQLYEDSEATDLSGIPRKVVIRALQKDVRPDTGAPFFPAAICSRFASGNVVMFNHIGAHDLSAIAKKEICRHAASLEKEAGIKFVMDEQVFTALLLAEGSTADARTVRSRAEAFYNDELYELFRLIASDKVKTGIEAVEQICFNVDLESSKKEIADLFIPNGKPCVLVFGEEKDVQQCLDSLPDFEILGVQTVEAAIAAMKQHDIDFVLLDMKCGAPEQTRGKLNLEDMVSPARDFIKFLRERRKELPVYLMEQQRQPLSEEERVSFLRQGVRGVVTVTKSRSRFACTMRSVANSLHQQASMVKLAKENKVISFETAQTVSKNGKTAHIKLFDFSMTVAVESEDAKSVLSAASRPTVRFEDVIGAEDAKKELAYFVSYLRDPKKYMGTGVKAPRGVILYGPPGTGKTMLAKAMACEAGVTFLAAEGNQFLKQHVGEGSQAVHKLFRTARKYAPAILFIDEIDAIAKERRGTGSGEETLTAFLTEMDGFDTDPSRPVFVLAATNFDVEPGSAKSLDPALMRRFDRRVYIDLPDKAARIRFLHKKIQSNRALEISGEMVDNLAVRSTGMSLAELDSVLELALRSAIREGSTTVNDSILEEAFETFTSGEEKKWDASQLERVARHESGHALLCWLGGEKPSYLTIVARGKHGGYMQREAQEGKAIYTRDELLARIRTSLGGRAAELVYYGDRDGISTGASADLRSATQMAQRIICVYGMDEEFGLAVDGITDAGGVMTDAVRKAVNRILKEQMAEAIRLVTENRDKIDALAETLMAKNHLNGVQIAQVIREGALTETK